MENMHLDQHISKQFNTDLEKLRTAVLEMGGLVEGQLADAVKAIETGSMRLAEKVQETEDEVNQYEVNIDAQCTEVLARRQPAASDLRLVLIVSKAIRDLERVGDESSKIARMAIELSDEETDPDGFVELRHMSSNVQKMLNAALDAFARFDVPAALKVMREDKHVDREYKSAIREMVTMMMEDPRSISRVLNVIWSLRALERIGDHARNIAEHVIYLVRGTDVRHISIKEIEKQLDQDQ
ncbi:phosphate signaling complex protein PhoU [Teredinibacter turnerae]|uniref:Phosphate-specific transport system accessory protein PhoU n=1 Tax=Teredinibacter turnerae (strain ATCC 39867 / T7901) TaxID=377629 RepID=C5BJU0_TERTT|nr:phosphate signaling complex protein PhoU [Teredinibacter turnerae]ACR12950.1 phosphate transport system regulatory protein PhoU [Teredinibacter turnerae T7901]